MPLLHLHDAPRLARDDGTALALAAREAALLAWLHLAGPTPRARIAGLLWPGGTEAQARANLRQTLARLKRAAGALVDEHGGTLQLAVAVAEPGAAETLLGTVAFDDAPEFATWLEARRDEALRRHQREGLAAAQQALAAGDLATALAGADAVLATHPESEEAWRLRMEVLHRRGDRASALQAWDDCRHALRAAFGVAPSAETQALGQRLLADDAAPGAADTGLPPALRRPPRLVGRDDALATLSQALALGHGGVVLGPGGIGKTRLLAELAQRHGPALMTGARPGDAREPGALLARLVGAALRRFQPALDADTQRELAALQPGAASGGGSALAARRLQAAVLRALQACMRGAPGGALRLVVVDDLHHADEASLEALQGIVGAWLAQAAGEGAPPLFAGRGDELPPAAQALLELAGRAGRLARVELAPLAPAQVEAFVATLVGAEASVPPALAGALHAQVGGNPAFLLESLKSLWLDGLQAWAPGRGVPVPATLREAVHQRLRRLSQAALQLAQLAAVAQADFSLALAAAAGGQPLLALAPPLRELAQAQVFDGQAFAHDLVADAVRATLPPALAAALHGLVAGQLARDGGAPGAVAFHLQAAGRARDALPWLRRAAAEARARWQLSDAARAHEAVARTLDPVAERAEALAAWLAAARCWLKAARRDPARAALDAAQPLLRTPLEHTLHLGPQTHWLFSERRLKEAVAAAERLIDELLASGDAVPADDLADAVRAVGSLVAYGVSGPRALALADAALARAPAFDDEALLALRTARGSLLHWMLRPLEAEAELGPAWRAALARGEPGAQVTLGYQLARVQHALGDLPGAMAVCEALLRVAERVELGAMTHTDVMHMLAMMRIAAGRPAEGVALFDALLQRLQRLGEKVPDTFRTSHALALINVGRHADAEASLALHPPPGREGHVLPDLAWRLTRARLAFVKGEPVQPWLDALGDLRALPAGLLLQAEVAAATLAPPPGAVLAPLRERLARNGQRGLLRSVELAASRAALAAGDAAAAAAHARAALALQPHVDGWVDEPASGWWFAAQALQAAGAEEEAAAALAAGRRFVEERSAAWTQAQERAAWRETNPLHRALLASASG